VAERAYRGDGSRVVRAATRAEKTIIPDDAEPPVCAIHMVPMVLMHGRRGDFWSCHEKNSDGSWCTYKPSE
jgi:hypothetical protein